ncbi:hypothetical protein [Enterobacter sp. PTB]|uniref:hypothetical protein n=1 Tax=Enterobacter sp. PTB TaxID=3143437 RepID=UPI003DA7CAB5
MQNLMPPVNTPDNLFHDGDESTGVEGTILYAEFMNNEQSAIQDIQHEVINVLAEAGFTPDPAKQNQLLLAIQKIISDGVTDGIKGTVKTVNSESPDDAGNVKLGSAADADIVTSMTDTTAGRVPVVGWMGTGGPEIPIPDGTDIYKYFATAASGNYGGGGNLVNKVTSSGWVSFKWQQHGSDKRYGVLFEQSSGGKMALHIYNNQNGDMTSPEKYWSNSGLLFSEKNPPTAAQAGALPITGGKLTGNLEINDNAPIIQFSEADTGKKYFIVVDGSGLRIDEDSTAGNSILSYAGASKQMKTVGQFVPGDYGNFDSRYLKLTGGTLTGNLTVQSTIQVGGIGSGVLNIGDNDSGLRSSKDGQVDLWANSKMMGYWNTTTFSFTGQIVPTDYTNFDDRYKTKYPTLFRVGARVTYNGSDFGSHVPQGAVNINNYTNNDDRINGVVYAYLQYNLNGNWVNFA